MNIKQKRNFTPVVITLETEEEAIAFAGVIDQAQGANILDDAAHAMAIELANAFTNSVNI